MPRAVTRYLTLRYDRMMLQLDPTPLARELAGKKIEMVNYPDGRFAVGHQGIALPFRVFDKIQTVAPGATTPAAAKQSGGTGYADKGPSVAQGTGSSCSRVRPPERPGVI
jgi:hypothetical protein